MKVNFIIFTLFFQKICKSQCFENLGDEIGGLSVSPRENDDIIQIWNTRADLHDKATIESGVKRLLSGVQIIAMFYKGNKMNKEFFYDICKKRKFE